MSEDKVTDLNEYREKKKQEEEEEEIERKKKILLDKLKRDGYLD